MAYHIEVDRKLSKTLTTEHQGRDLFILIYDDLANHDIVELDFIDCDEIKSEFFEGFINASRDSTKLPLSILEEKVIFSGLYYENIICLHNAILAAKHEKDTQAQISTIMPEIREALNKFTTMKR